MDVVCHITGPASVGPPLAEPAGPSVSEMCVGGWVAT